MYKICPHLSLCITKLFQRLSLCSVKAAREFVNYKLLRDAEGNIVGYCKLPPTNSCEESGETKEGLSRDSRPRLESATSRIVTRPQHSVFCINKVYITTVYSACLNICHIHCCTHASLSSHVIEKCQMILEKGKVHVRIHQRCTAMTRTVYSLFFAVEHSFNLLQEKMLLSESKFRYHTA